MVPAASITVACSSCEPAQTMHPNPLRPPYPPPVPAGLGPHLGARPARRAGDKGHPGCRLMDRPSPFHLQDDDPSRKTQETSRMRSRSMFSKDVYWLRSLVGVTGCISWLFACGSVAYALAVIASGEYAVVDHLESIEVKSGLLLIALSGAATMITGMIGSCGALRFARNSLLLLELDLRRKFDRLLLHFDPTSAPLNAETQRLDSIQALVNSLVNHFGRSNRVLVT
ncbi:unnamed protein product [Schistocephalus solidus]|uniref:ABC transmembrane type-1 domain-containing protein n=1 Tax=Schistocephalus solidus TaxID=70667 RepID=A0A183SR30_SCHSO|nr:unnamed protein product [Schistocephalus solidus]